MYILLGLYLYLYICIDAMINVLSFSFNCLLLEYISIDYF